MITCIVLKKSLPRILRLWFLPSMSMIIEPTRTTIMYKKDLKEEPSLTKG
jgi:hypothetical protein